MRSNTLRQWAVKLVAFAAIGVASMLGQTPSTGDQPNPAPATTTTTTTTTTATKTDDKKADEPVHEMEKMIVTGSNLPTAADALDVPVTILGQSMISMSGINTNPLELLRKSVPSFAGGRSNTGNSNAANTNQATGGGSQLFLRNLPTLVLVDGRRVTYNSLNGAGGKNFVDVNMFPLSAIERVEVLSDGASAIYGSDAVGGVVNFILKANYEGLEVGARYAVTNNTGNYNEKSAYAIGGVKNDSVSVTLSANWSKTAPLFQFQRPFIKNDPRSNLALPGSVGGNILAYGLNTPSSANPTGVNATAPNMAALVANGTYLGVGDPRIVPFNIAPYTSILQQSELKSTALEWRAKVNDKLSLFGNFLGSKTGTQNELATSISNEVQVGVTVPAGSPYNPIQGAISGVVVGTADRPQQTINHSEAYLATVGLAGKISDDYSYEVGYTYSFSQEQQEFTQVIFLPAFAAAIAGGYDANGNAVAGGAYSRVISGFNVIGAPVLQPALDPFARTGRNPASLANVYGTEIQRTDASLGSVDAKIVATPIQLPAGKIGIAVGGAVRLETLTGTPDNNSYNASTDPTKHNWANGGTFFDPFAKKRGVKSVYVEARIPVTSKDWNVPGFYALDLTAAARAETYTDFGNSKVPKLGFRWQPIDDSLTIRFTYGKSFAAPFLIDVFGPPSFVQGPLPVSGINSGVSYFSGNGNNPSLGPAKAWSRSTGVVYSPKSIPGLTLSASYINVFEAGFQVGIGALTALPSVQALGSASPFFSTMSVHAPPGQPGAAQGPISAPGSLYAYVNSPTYTNDLYFLDHKINGGGVQEKAIDFNIDYAWNTASLGHFQLTISGSYLQSVRVSATPGAPFFEFAGYSNNAGLLAGSNAKWNTYTTFNWDYHNWSWTVGNLYRNRMIDINSGTLPAIWLATNPATYVSYYTSWDTRLGYSIPKKSGDSWRYLSGFKIAVGINNVFNRMPPAAPLSQPAIKNNNNVDVAAYSPIGRLFYVEASKKF